MSHNLAILSGSQRKCGNTVRLASAFIDGVESSGKSVMLFRVADMRVGGCMGCDHCFEVKGVCVQKDDVCAHT